MESQNKRQATEFKKILNPHTKINVKVQEKKDIPRMAKNPNSNQKGENPKQIVKKLYNIINRS